MKTKIWFRMKHDKYATCELEEDIIAVSDGMQARGGLILYYEKQKLFVPNHCINGIEEIDA